MKKFFIALAIVIIIFFVTLGGFYFFAPSHYNILIIGSDQREGLKEGDVKITRGRSDVLMVVSFAKSGKQPITILMIPRDTLIVDKDYGTEKICHFYALGDRYESTVMGNLPLTQQKVESLLNIKMNATFEATFDGFASVIDLLGGVDTDEGHLTTEEALELIHNRYSQTNGDFGRAEEQRKILKAVLEKIKQPSYASLVYNYIRGSKDVRLKYNKASVVIFSIAYLLGHQGHLNLHNTNEIVLPGEGTMLDGAYYWQVDESSMKDMINQHLK